MAVSIRVGPYFPEIFFYIISKLDIHICKWLEINCLFPSFLFIQLIFLKVNLWEDWSVDLLFIDLTLLYRNKKNLKLLFSQHSLCFMDPKAVLNLAFTAQHTLSICISFLSKKQHYSGNISFHFKLRFSPIFH